MNFHFDSEILITTNEEIAVVIQAQRLTRSSITYVLVLIDGTVGWLCERALDQKSWREDHELVNQKDQARDVVKELSVPSSSRR